jgi:hypothetical protein
MPQHKMYQIHDLSLSLEIMAELSKEAQEPGDGY